ncbi:fadD29 [Symbiodinium sp. CCMP2456]|nr:fadD29 [Symbiodinium sp. CCMP2456]
MWLSTVPLHVLNLGLACACISDCSEHGIALLQLGHDFPELVHTVTPTKTPKAPRTNGLEFKKASYLQYRELGEGTKLSLRWLSMLALLLLGFWLVYCAYVHEPDLPEGVADRLLQKAVPRSLSECKVVPDFLRLWAHQTPEKTAFVFCDKEGSETDKRSYASLASRSAAIAQTLLSEWAAVAGDRALLVYEPGLEFIDAFLGCLVAGTVAVPVYPPMPGREADMKRFRTVQEDAGASLALTSRAYMWASSTFIAEWPVELTWKVTTGLDEKPWAAPIPSQGNQLAFLQYTSGSTGDPKGVMISHANLVTNCLIPNEPAGNSRTLLGRPKFQRFGCGSVAVGWCPQYHDLGLVGGILTSLVWNATHIGCSPVDFIKDPLLWPRLITKFHGTVTASPHFGYQLTARRMEAALKARQSLALDLSSLTAALDAAEPINVRERDSMLATWQKFGLRQGAYFAGYGLAEHVVKVACGGVEGLAGAVESIADCGEACDGVTIKIVDPDQCVERTDGQEGEIWLDSPSKAAGYWGQPELSQEVFHARLDGRTYLRTGDLGFLQNGRLFVSGRRKNLIIIGGKNFYPHDIEQTVQSRGQPHVRPGCIVATSNANLTGTEQLLIAAEVRHDYPAELAAALRREVEAEHGLEVYGLVLLETHSIPKTTSGKLKHREVAQLWELSAFPGELERHMYGFREGPAIKWTRETRADRVLQLERWLLDEVVDASPEKALAELGLSSLAVARLHARMLQVLETPLEEFRKLPTPSAGSADFAEWDATEPCYIRRNVPETALGLGIFINCRSLAAVAVEAELQKFPRDLAECSEADRSLWAPDRRTYAAGLPATNDPVPAWLVTSFQTLGLLMPVLVLATPMFFLVQAVDALHVAAGHGSVFLAAPPLLALLVGAMFLEVLLLRVVLFPHGLLPGRYTLHGWTHLRLWLLDASLGFLQRLVGPYGGTPIHNGLLRILGASVGTGAKIHVQASAALQLLQVGDGCSLDGRVQCHMILDNELLIDKVQVGHAVFVPERCAIEPGVVIGDGSSLQRMTSLAAGACVPTGSQGVVGNPARKGESRSAEPVADIDWLKFRYACVFHAYVFAALLYLLFFSARFMWSFVGPRTAAGSLLTLLALAPAAFWLAGAAALLAFVLLKLLLVGKVSPGQMPASQHAWYRLVNFILSSSWPIWISSLPECLHYFGLLAVGAAVSPNAVVRLDASLRALKCGDLLTVGPKCFIGGCADFAFEGPDRHFYKTDLGNSYFGASSFVDFGCTFGSGAVVSSQSYVPPQSALEADSVYMGNPAGLFSRSSRAEGLRPTWLHWVLHTVCLGSCVRAIGILPMLVVPVVCTWMKLLVLRSVLNSDVISFHALGLFVAGSCAVAVVAFMAMIVITLLLYWTVVLLLRRCSEEWPEIEAKRYSLQYYCWVLQVELLASSRFWLIFLKGTFWIAAFLRLLGAEIGSGVCFEEHCPFFEPWLLQIGDGCCFSGAMLSPHSIDTDHGITAKHVRVGRRAVILDSLVHGGTEVPVSSILGSLSRPLQGQCLRLGGEYNSTPALLRATGKARLLADESSGTIPCAQDMVDVEPPAKTEP